MSKIEHFIAQASRAERLARCVTDTLTIKRLLEASAFYRGEAERIELALRIRSD